MSDPQTIGDVTARQKLANRRAIFKSIMGNPRALTLTRRQYNLMRQLLLWINPATGHLRYQTMNCTLERELRISTSTLARARRELIELGLIIGYTPGDGRACGRYTLARTWEEADAHAEERKRAGGKPYFPPNPQRTAPPRAAKPPAQPQQPAAQQPRAPRQRRPAEGLSVDRLPQYQHHPEFHDELATRAAEIDVNSPARLAAQAAAREAIKKRPSASAEDPPAA